VRGEILDQRRRALDNVRVEPEHPRRGGAEGGEEERVAGARHAGAPRALVLHLVPLRLVLVVDGRVEVLPFDGDAREALPFGAGLRLGDGGLEGGCGGVSFAGLGDDEAEGDEFVGVCEAEEVFPVAVVEAGQRG